MIEPVNEMTCRRCRVRYIGHRILCEPCWRQWRDHEALRVALDTDRRPPEWPPRFGDLQERARRWAA